MIDFNQQKMDLKKSMSMDNCTENETITKSRAFYDYNLQEDKKSGFMNCYCYD
jgi:hypothetical protein